MDRIPHGVDVLRFLGWPEDPETRLQADEHVVRVAHTARAYTRGRGFAPDDWALCEEDIKTVILSAAARSLNNPAQDRSVEAGGFRSQPGYFSGWNLAELAVLNRYRRRAA